MTRIAAIDAAAAVTIQADAVVSKVVYHDEALDVTVFGIDGGQGLMEHTASRAAIVQVLRGRLRFTVEDEVLDVRPGYWIKMAAGAPHLLVAEEPTVMMLTLLGP